MQKRKSSIEIKGIIKKYLGQGLKQVEIATLLGISKQKLHYWIRIIRGEDQGGY